MEQILDFMRGVYTQHFSEICVMILGCIFRTYDHEFTCSETLPQTGEGDSKTNRRNAENVF